MEINFTLFGQMLTFGLFAGCAARWVWPPVQTILAERRARIATGLAEAAASRQLYAETEARRVETLHAARVEAEQIVLEARSRAAALEAESLRQAKAAQMATVAATEAEIARLYAQAKAALCTDVAALVTEGVTRVLERQTL